MARSNDPAYEVFASEETIMPYCVLHFFPGGTKEQYEASIAAAHPARNVLPEGQTRRSSRPHPATLIGRTISRSSFRTLRAFRLAPMSGGTVSGFEKC